ncbi:MAG: trigger factor, partial [Bryobacterales bacterium]|nr:trigger factor [Bryobacterales bacterium]
MALVEGCKHFVEVTVPVEAIEEETTKIAGGFQKRARIPGFRPGKAPASMIRKHFESDIRQQVLEALVPKYFDTQVKQDNLKVVGQPTIVDVHFHAGEPLRFKAEFEVFPDFDIKNYHGLTVPYKEPEVSDADVDERIDQIRNDKATFVNEEPRPLADGDFAVISLESIGGADEPVKTDETSLEVGGKDTIEGFTDNLRGMSPGEEKDFDVIYPEEYGQPKLAGKTIRFHCVVKGVRRKELPELNDEFAQDLGDYRTVDELREAVRKGIFAQRQQEAQREAKDKLVETMVDENEFPVPEAFVDRQIRNRVEQSLRGLAEQGVDPKTLKLDWEKVKEGQRDRAVREVKASLLLGKVSEREDIGATKAEVDREVELLARQR